MRVGVVGTGWVGTSVAISTLHAGVAQELWLADARAEVAAGEALDLAQGGSFYPACEVRAVSVGEMVDADVLVVAAGRGGSPDESRLDLLQANARILRAVLAEAGGFTGTLVVVTNPVDVLVQVAADAADIPVERVLGTGTMLDTARLRQILGARLGVDPRSVHGYVLGEHGDSSVVAWSGVRVGGVPLRKWPGWSREAEVEISTQVRRAAYEIIQRKGATNHAIGLVTAELLRTLARDERRIHTVTRVQRGAMGVEGVALSLPAIVGATGAAQVLEPALDAAEHEALAASSQVLREAYEQVAE